MLFRLPGSKSAREKVISTRENSEKYGRENDFCTREKKSKKPESAREKWQVRREKSEKSEKKWAWKPQVAREKMQKKVQNRFSRPLSFSRPKKKTLVNLKCNDLPLIILSMQIISRPLQNWS